VSRVRRTLAGACPDNKRCCLLSARQPALQAAFLHLESQPGLVARAARSRVAHKKRCDSITISRALTGGAPQLFL
jgi:hypothetical protein